MHGKGLNIACLGLALALAIAPVPLAAQDAPPPLPKEVVDAANSLKPQHGKIALPEARATLDLGTAYDFYGPDDARKILTTIWGNPPGAGDGILGLVMPAGKGPLTDAWGAVVTYDPSGYVSDEDAATVDYTKILEQLREGEAEDNAERRKNGYPELTLMGWAEQPHYDRVSHSVIWARDLKVSNSQTDGLNYDVRTLGRGGVLSLNLISGMDHLDEVKAAAHEFASHASFDPGARYADFDPNMDKKAEYGIGGLVAAGVGVAVAKKLGFFAILLKFLKPLLIAVVAGFAVLKNRLKGLFGRNKGPLEG